MERASAITLLLAITASSAGPALVSLDDGPLVVHNTSELRRLIDEQLPGTPPLVLRLPAGAIFGLGGEALNVSGGKNVSLESDGEGAVLDGLHQSRVVVVHGGGWLTLRRVHLLHGWVADGSGGCALVNDSSSRLRVHATRIAACVAHSVSAYSQSQGGGIYVQSGEQR